MVGRGGRSRACFICRQRRLKCGELRNAYPDPSDVKLILDLDETKPECLRCQNSGLECTGYPEGLLFINDNPASRLQRSTRSQRSRSPQQIEPGLNLSVLGRDVYFAYLGQELQNGDTLLDGRWPGFCALQMPDCLSRRCMASFAASFFGRRTRNERASREGMRFYVESLGELNDRLSQPDDSPSAQTVLAIGILTVCEVGS